MASLQNYEKILDKMWYIQLCTVLTSDEKIKYFKAENLGGLECPRGVLLELTRAVLCAVSIVPDSSRPHGLYSPPRLLCPWNFPGENTGEGCQFLLQGTFLTRGSRLRLLHLLHLQMDSLPQRHPGRP